MILVCGGLADGVTELVCARLEHCRLPSTACWTSPTIPSATA